MPHVHVTQAFMQAGCLALMVMHQPDTCRHSTCAGEPMLAVPILGCLMMQHQTKGLLTTFLSAELLS